MHILWAMYGYNVAVCDKNVIVTLDVSTIEIQHLACLEKKNVQRHMIVFLHDK